jgi:RNA polymerase sigma-70 factor (ECF subfamily)
MTPPLASGEPLLDGLRAGRRDAFERLYGEYSAPIYNLCARILGDREEAKDVTQEVFLKAFDRLPAADAGPLNLRAWLYRVATNACLNHLRSRRRLDGGGEARLEHAAAEVDEFERARTVALVEQSLGEMNERYRTALVLKDLQGLPPEEIAEVMEVSRPTADVLVHRARASFKTVFAQLAGEGAAAPAALGLVLTPLSVPAALQAMPPLPASLTPIHTLPHPDISAAAGPAGAGLLAKIGAGLTAKAAITVATAAVVIGGGAVVMRETRIGDPRAAGTAASAPADAARARPAAWTPGGSGHDGRKSHGDPSGRERAHHLREARDHAARGDHSGGAVHDAGTHDAEGDAALSTSTHDDASTTSSHTSSEATSTSTTTHDSGGDVSTGHDGSDD